MARTIISMYVTLMAPIVAGVINSVWCKTNLLNCLKVPMDGNRNLSDGKRIFGDNKTWKGFWGYIVLNIFFAVGWGFCCSLFGIEEYNYFYTSHSNTPVFNLLIGWLLGLGYALFELPNSFLKRRLDIVPGKGTKGIKKYFFIFLDQADSVFGCVLVVLLFYPMTLQFYLGYVLLGAGTHIVINMLLYFMRLRKNMF